MLANLLCNALQFLFIQQVLDVAENLIMGYESPVLSNKDLISPTQRGLMLYDTSPQVLMVS